MPIERTVIGALSLMGLIVALGGFMQTAFIAPGVVPALAVWMDVKLSGSRGSLPSRPRAKAACSRAREVTEPS